MFCLLNMVNRRKGALRLRVLLQHVVNINSSQPQTGPCPERIGAVYKGQIAGNQSQQCCHRKMNKTRMNRVAKYLNLAVNRFHRHLLPQQPVKSTLLALLRCSPALFNQSIAVFWPAILLLSLSGCSGGQY